MTPPSDPKPDPLDYAALAQRYMDLWQEQAAKLAQDPTLTTSLAAAWSKMAPGGPFPFPNPAAPHAGFPTPGTDGTQTSPPPSGDGRVDLAAVLRRLDDLERRLEVLELAKSPAAAPGSPTKGSRRKPSGAG